LLDKIIFVKGESRLRNFDYRVLKKILIPEIENIIGDGKIYTDRIFKMCSTH
jgi:hypothetical protein